MRIFTLFCSAAAIKKYTDRPCAVANGRTTAPRGYPIVPSLPSPSPINPDCRSVRPALAGKTYTARLIKDQEVANKGSAPRILSLDDYFCTEKEKTVTDPDTGKSVTKKAGVAAPASGLTRETARRNSSLEMLKLWTGSSRAAVCAV